MGRRACHGEGSVRQNVTYIGLSFSHQVEFVCVWRGGVQLAAKFNQETLTRYGEIWFDEQRWVKRVEKMQLALVAMHDA